MATYASPNNMFSGKLAINADNLVPAQDKFFAWLKEQEVYNHMWEINIKFEQLEGLL